MQCPFCQHLETAVIETREREDSAITRRRRECPKCQKRFTTYERVENVPLIVIKKDGRRENFDREKLRGGILKACEKRPVSFEIIEELVDKIERNLRKRDSAEVSSRNIGSMILRELKKIDKVAYLRFASVYLDFEDLADFEDIIKKLE